MRGSALMVLAPKRGLIRHGPILVASSGGLDSALLAAIAREGLGAMPK
ncbi:MAG: hypothetical protein ABFC89_07495 [Methanospirillum sp.]